MLKVVGVVVQCPSYPELAGVALPRQWAPKPFQVIDFRLVFMWDWYYYRLKSRFLYLRIQAVKKRHVTQQHSSLGRVNDHQEYVRQHRPMHQLGLFINKI